MKPTITIFILNTIIVIVGGALIYYYFFFYFIPTWEINKGAIEIEYISCILTVQSISYVFWPIIFSSSLLKELNSAIRVMLALDFAVVFSFLIASIVYLSKMSLDPNPELSMYAFSYATSGFFFNVMLLTMIGIIFLFLIPHKDTDSHSNENTDERMEEPPPPPQPPPPLAIASKASALKIWRLRPSEPLERQ